MDRRFLGILGAIIVVFVAIFLITQNSGNNSGSNSKNSSTQPTHHVEGQGQKGVTLVEYGDYECPVCEGYYLPLKQVVSQYSKDIYFQFRNLPLTAIHQNAFAAARAAEAAGMQGKFWQMHDKLYDNQDEWVSASNPLDIFTTYAQQLGLNVNQFKQDYASSKVNDAINADLAAFNQTGKDKATPTFFLDGKYLPNTELVDPQTSSPSVSQIGQVLQAEIAKKSGSSAAPANSSTTSQTPTTPSSQQPAAGGNPY